MFKFFTTLSENEARNISPVTLAFVGDAVYTLYVRERLVVERDLSTGALQKLSSSEVSAHGQNILLEKIIPLLSEEEIAVFKRGRNAKTFQKQKRYGFRIQQLNGVRVAFGLFIPRRQIRENRTTFE